MNRSIRVVFFASAREAAGASFADRDVPAGGAALTTVLAGLVEEHPRLAPVFKGARFVRNGRYVRSPRTRVKPGDEIAVHPPYSGG